MTTALVGFLGVIAGGILSGAVQAIIAWRDRYRAARVAARLLFFDLVLVEQRIRVALKSGFWPMRSDWDEFVAPWTEHRGSLAAQLNTPEFMAVAGTSTVIAQLELMRTAAIRNAGEERAPLDDAAQALLGRALGMVSSVAKLVYRASFTRREGFSGKARDEDEIGAGG